MGQVGYAAPDPDWSSRIETRDERLWDPAAVLADGTGEFIYTYDFGDDWRHHIRVEATLEPSEKNRRPLCAAGTNACTPEDLGGLPGCSDFLQAITDPGMQWDGRPHPQLREPAKVAVSPTT